MSGPLTGTLASNTPTAGFPSPEHGDPALELTGSGSVTGELEYLLNDGVTYAPNVVATDGGAPTIMDKIAYNGGTQNGVRIALMNGHKVRFNPGAVTGTVNFAFVEG